MSSLGYRWLSAHGPAAQLSSKFYRCRMTWGQNIQNLWALKLGKVKHWIRGTVSFFESHSWPVSLGHSFQIRTIPPHILPTSEILLEYLCWCLCFASPKLQKWSDIFLGASLFFCKAKWQNHRMVKVERDHWRLSSLCSRRVS